MSDLGGGRPPSGRLDPRPLKAALLEVCEHYAGVPASRKTNKTKVVSKHACPSCGTNSLEAVLFTKPDTPAGGSAGCSNGDCPVPPKKDAIGLIAYFEGYGEDPAWFKTAIQRGYEILGLSPDGNPALPGELETPADRTARPDSPAEGPSATAPHEEDSGGCTRPDDAGEPRFRAAGKAAEPTSPVPPETPDQVPPSYERHPVVRNIGPSNSQTPVVRNIESPNRQPDATAPAREELVGDEPRNAKPADGAPFRADGPTTGESGPEGVPAAHQDEGDGGSDEAEESEVPVPDWKSPLPEAKLARRDRVYTALLGLCPRDEKLERFFAGLGVGEAVVRRGSFGIFYAANGSTVLAELNARFGVAGLSAVPGFAADHGPLRSELEGDDRALVPYRDARGRVIAVEVFDLAAAGAHRLLGEKRGGRDEGLGGANHLWSACEPPEIEAVTDDLLEAMRASSAGARCAGLRSPEAHTPGAGRKTLPELNGVSFSASRVLYAPGLLDPERASAAAPKAARAVIAPAGSEPLVLGKPPYDVAGLGTYLLSQPPGEQRGAFERLFGERYATPLPREDTPDGSSLESRREDVSDTPAEPGREAFHAQLLNRPKKPTRKEDLTTTERDRGILAGAGAFLVLFPLLSLTMAPFAGIVHALSGAMAGYAPPEAVTAGGGPDLSNAWSVVGGILEPVLGPVAAGLAGPLAILATALSSVLAAVVISWVVAVSVGRYTALSLRGARFERIAMLEGRIQEPGKKKRRGTFRLRRRSNKTKGGTS